jgi:hypothetical protein
MQRHHSGLTVLQTVELTAVGILLHKEASVSAFQNHMHHHFTINITEEWKYFMLCTGPTAHEQTRYNNINQSSNYQ